MDLSVDQFIHIQSKESFKYSVYQRGFRSIRDSQPDLKEEAVMLLEAWRTFEKKAESSSEEQRQKAVQAVERKMPKRIKKKRPVQTDEGFDAGMEVRFLLFYPSVFLRII